MNKTCPINYQKGLNNHNYDESRYHKLLNQFDHFLKIELEKLHNQMLNNDWSRVSRTALALKDFSK